MFVKSLELSNFRNYNTLSMNFKNGTNILYGDNAQGKTNILEAVYLAGTTKSHKGSQLNQEESHIRMFIEKNLIVHRIDMHLKKNKPKGVAIDGIPIRKSSELFGLINLVFFSPEDLSIIKNGPSDRRRFIDFELCQLDKLYLSDLTNYNKIINQRNNLLKQIGFKPELMGTLSVWDIQLCEFGRRIIKRRTQFILELNEIVYGIHKRLSGGKEELVIKYEPNVLSEDMEAKVEKQREKDVFYKQTSIGPHRDDICFTIKDIDIRKFGSQGQQRTSALSLKLAEIELVRQTIKDEPILLLDDVLSELDRNRQNYLLNSIEGIQTMITCTGLEEFVANRFHIDKLYRVVEGSVTVENE